MNLDLYSTMFKNILQLEKNHQFYVMTIILLFSLFVDIRNAGAIQDNTAAIEKHGEELQDHSKQLHELNSKFEIFIAYANERKKHDDEQDEKIRKLEEKDKEQDEKIKELEKKAK